MDLGKRFIIRSNTLDPKPGNLLISEPLMNDFHFGRSVVLLIEHEESEGSFGVIICFAELSRKTPFGNDKHQA